MLKPADFVDQYANGAPQHAVDTRMFGRIAAFAREERVTPGRLRRRR
jgi:hypothetical protein